MFAINKIIGLDEKLYRFDSLYATYVTSPPWQHIIIMNNNDSHN